MDLITKREDRSIVLHIILGVVFIIASGVGSYAATHSHAHGQVIVSQ